MNDIIFSNNLVEDDDNITLIIFKDMENTYL